MIPRIDRRYLLLAALLVTIISAYRCFIPPAPIPTADALGYVNNAINLTEHGVLSELRYKRDNAPKSERISTGPLMIAELVIVSQLSADTHATFICALTSNKPKENCAVSVLGLRIAHFIEIMIFFTGLWFLARKTLGNELCATLACLFALGFKEVFLFSRVPLTEPIFNMLIVWFLFAWVCAIDDANKKQRWLVAGILLGLTVLVKSAFVSLIILAPLLLAPFFIRARGGLSGHISAMIFMLIGYGVIAGPFHALNFIYYGSAVLTEPIYFNASLSHRLGYSLMSLREWTLGWIYYLPDFGDTLANALFGKEATSRLGWGDDSLYAYGLNVLQWPTALETRSGPARLFNAIMADPVNFIGVSLLLMWRGIFVGKYFGMAGLFSLPYTLIRVPADIRIRLFALGLPAFAMAGVHAAVSVSLTRYNLALIPLYACSLAWIAASLMPVKWHEALQPA